METTSDSKGNSKGKYLGPDCTVEQPGIRNQQRYQRWPVVPIVLLLVMFLLTGCTDAFGSSGTRLADSSSPVPIATEPQISLEPSSGTVGTFVTVTGHGWKPSAMITVRLADGEGQSNVLAAENTDENGVFSTGFLYPIGNRWTLPGSYDVVVSLQDDEVTVAKPFVVESPGGGVDKGVAIPTLVTSPTATLIATATPEMAKPTIEPTYTIEYPTPPALLALPSSPPDSGPPASRGGSFNITESHQTLTLTCNGHSVIVSGSDNTSTLLGSCGRIVVRGNANRIFYQEAASITNTGSNNFIQQR